jgi:mRNA-degrading endonuclease RelE of RelBE toxin-antitoxin system
MTYQVIVGREAKKKIEKLDRSIAERIRGQLRKLAASPFDPRISKSIENGSREKVYPGRRLAHCL